MATKSSSKKSSKKAAKGRAKGVAKGGSKGRKKLMTGGSPIIVTGGSMAVEFNPEFKDADGLPSFGHKKIKKVNHPQNRKIVAVVVTDRSTPPVELHRYAIPARLNGRCRVVIESDS